MFVQTQLHLFFKIVTISPWSMIVWGNVLLRRTVCGDIDWHWHHHLASWLDPDDEFAQVVETSVNVTTNIPSRDYTHLDNHTSPTYRLMGPNLLQNYNRLKFQFSFKAHLHPKSLAHRGCCLWILCNTKLFLSRFSLKIHFLQSHLVENRP